jgi:hypothetical protein
VSVDAGYYRNWFGNFRVTRNLAVTPTDFDPYCITAPADPALPGGAARQTPAAVLSTRGQRLSDPAR